MFSGIFGKWSNREQQLLSEYKDAQLNSQDLAIIEANRNPSHIDYSSLDKLAANAFFREKTIEDLEILALSFNKDNGKFFISTFPHRLAIFRELLARENSGIEKVEADRALFKLLNSELSLLRTTFRKKEIYAVASLVWLLNDINMANWVNVNFPSILESIKENPSEGKKYFPDIPEAMLDETLRAVLDIAAQASKNYYRKLSEKEVVEKASEFIKMHPANEEAGKSAIDENLQEWVRSFYGNKEQAFSGEDLIAMLENTRIITDDLHRVAIIRALLSQETISNNEKANVLVFELNKNAFAHQDYVVNNWILNHFPDLIEKKFSQGEKIEAKKLQAIFEISDAERKKVLVELIKSNKYRDDHGQFVRSQRTLGFDSVDEISKARESEEVRNILTGISSHLYELNDFNVRDLLALLSSGTSTFGEKVELTIADDAAIFYALLQKSNNANDLKHALDALAEKPVEHLTFVVRNPESAALLTEKYPGGWQKVMPKLAEQDRRFMSEAWKKQAVQQEEPGKSHANLLLAASDVKGKASIHDYLSQVDINHLFAEKTRGVFTSKQLTNLLNNAFIRDNENAWTVITQYIIPNEIANIDPVFLQDFVIRHADDTFLVEEFLAGKFGEFEPMELLQRFPAEKTDEATIAFKTRIAQRIGFSDVEKYINHLVLPGNEPLIEALLMGLSSQEANTIYQNAKSSSLKSALALMLVKTKKIDAETSDFESIASELKTQTITDGASLVYLFNMMPKKELSTLIKAWAANETPEAYIVWLKKLNLTGDQFVTILNQLPIEKELMESLLTTIFNDNNEWLKNTLATISSGIDVDEESPAYRLIRKALQDPKWVSKLSKSSQLVVLTAKLSEKDINDIANSYQQRTMDVITASAIADVIGPLANTENVVQNVKMARVAFSLISKGAQQSVVGHFSEAYGQLISEKTKIPQIDDLQKYIRSINSEREELEKRVKTGFNEKHTFMLAALTANPDNIEVRKALLQDVNWVKDQDIQTLQAMTSLPAISSQSLSEVLKGLKTGFEVTQLASIALGKLQASFGELSANKNISSLLIRWWLQLSPKEKEAVKNSARVIGADVIAFTVNQLSELSEKLDLRLGADNSEVLIRFAAHFPSHEDAEGREEDLFSRQIDLIKKSSANYYFSNLKLIQASLGFRPDELETKSELAMLPGGMSRLGNRLSIFNDDIIRKKINLDLLPPESIADIIRSYYPLLALTQKPEDTLLVYQLISLALQTDKKRASQIITSLRSENKGEVCLDAFIAHAVAKLSEGVVGSYNYVVPVNNIVDYAVNLRRQARDDEKFRNHVLGMLDQNLAQTYYPAMVESLLDGSIEGLSLEELTMKAIWIQRILMNPEFVASLSQSEDFRKLVTTYHAISTRLKQDEYDALKTATLSQVSPEVAKRLDADEYELIEMFDSKADKKFNRQEKLDRLSEHKVDTAIIGMLTELRSNLSEVDSHISDKVNATLSTYATEELGKPRSGTLLQYLRKFVIGDLGEVGVSRNKASWFTSFVDRLTKDNIIQNVLETEQKMGVIDSDGVIYDKDKNAIGFVGLDGKVHEDDKQSTLLFSPGDRVYNKSGQLVGVLDPFGMVQQERLFTSQFATDLLLFADVDKLEELISKKKTAALLNLIFKENSIGSLFDKLAEAVDKASDEKEKSTARKRFLLVSRQLLNYAIKEQIEMTREASVAFARNMSHVDLESLFKVYVPQELLLAVLQDADRSKEFLLANDGSIDQAKVVAFYGYIEKSGVSDKEINHWLNQNIALDIGKNLLRARLLSSNNHADYHSLIPDLALRDFPASLIKGLHKDVRTEIINSKNIALLEYAIDDLAHDLTVEDKKTILQNILENLSLDEPTRTESIDILTILMESNQFGASAVIAAATEINIVSKRIFAKLVLQDADLAALSYDEQNINKANTDNVFGVLIAPNLSSMQDIVSPVGKLSKQGKAILYQTIEDPKQWAQFVAGVEKLDRDQAQEWIRFIVKGYISKNKYIVQPAQIREMMRIAGEKEIIDVFRYPKTSEMDSVTSVINEKLVSFFPYFFVAWEKTKGENTSTDKMKELFLAYFSSNLFTKETAQDSQMVFLLFSADTKNPLLKNYIVKEFMTNPNYITYLDHLTKGVQKDKLAVMIAEINRVNQVSESQQNEFQDMQERRVKLANKQFDRKWYAAFVPDMVRPFLVKDRLQSLDTQIAGADIKQAENETKKKLLLDQIAILEDQKAMAVKVVASVTSKEQVTLFVDTIIGSRQNELNRTDRLTLAKTVIDNLSANVQQFSNDAAAKQAVARIEVELTRQIALAKGNVFTNLFRRAGYWFADLGYKGDKNFIKTDAAAKAKVVESTKAEQEKLEKVQAEIEAGQPRAQASVFSERRGAAPVKAPGSLGMYGKNGSAVGEAQQPNEQPQKKRGWFGRKGK